MKRLPTLVLPIALLSVLSSCQEKTVEDAESTPAAVERDQQDILARGDKVASALLASLGSKLKGAMKSGGPEHAMLICQQIAQPSTAEVSDDFESLILSRVSLKPRNPVNAPDALDSEVLNGWEKQLSGGAAVPADVVRYHDDGTAVFYRPIMTQEVCLKCHGDPSAFSEELVAKLSELYPEDKATGYNEGQLRGAFRVEFPLQDK